MQNKKTFIIGTLILTTLAGGVLLRPQSSNSATVLTNEKPATCEAVMDNGFQALDKGWDQYVQNLLDQEKPVSSQVDDVFDSIRTYRCWMESFCKSIQVSASFPIQQGSLSSDQLGTDPGCPDPEDMELPPIWSDFLATVKQGNSTFIAPNPPGFAMIPQCRANEADRINAVSDLYGECLAKIEARFRESSKGTPEILTKLQALMLGTATEKKTRALENKLIEVNQKLDSMFSRVVLLTQYIHEMFNRIPCTIKECTKGG
jgi:hypothetical protein